MNHPKVWQQSVRVGPRMPRGKPTRADAIATPARAIRFTLIALLVVVAIIAILAALLRPAIWQARAKAESIMCLSNLKQIYLGFSFYAHDFDGNMPV